MITALLILNLLLLITIITMVIFYCRKPKPKIDEQAEREKEQRRQAIENIMNYNVDIARRAKRE